MPGRLSCRREVEEVRLPTACAVGIAVAMLALQAAGVSAEGTIPQEVLQQALAGTAIPLWLQAETPIEVLPDSNDGIVAFYYPYTRTIYLRASPYLQRGGKWDVTRVAEVLSHEFGHRFQHLAAPFGSPAWQRFEALTPTFSNGPRGVRSYQVWQMNREEAFAEAYRHLYGGIGAKSPPFVPLTITPAIRAYFQELDRSVGR